MNTNTNHPNSADNNINEINEGKMTNEEKLNPTDPGIEKRNPHTEVPQISDDEVETIKDQSKTETAKDTAAISEAPSITNSPDMTESKDSSSASDMAVI